MRYDKHFKEQAVLLAQDIGIKKASEQLGIPYHSLFDWIQSIKKYGQEAFPGSGHKQSSVISTEDRIKQLEKENREQQRTIEILREALGFFVDGRKK